MSASGDKAIARWLAKRQPRWKQIVAALEGLGERRSDPQDVDLIATEYRGLARDCSLTQRVLPGTRLTESLNALYARTHDALHRNPSRFWRDLKSLFQQDAPAVFAALRMQMTFVTLLFAVAALAGWLLISENPELAALFASPSMIDGMQQGELWTEGLFNVVPSAVLSVSIIQNNVMVTLFAFCLGAFFGLGTFYIIGLNGMMLGGIFAATHHYGLADGLFEFVVAHGLVEISVILIAGAAGMRVGEALARPGDMTRTEAFQNAVGDAAKLLPVGALLLVGCGLIEGYLSPDPGFPLASRIAVGVCYWVLMVLLLSGRMWRGSDAPLKS